MYVIHITVRTSGNWDVGKADFGLCYFVGNVCSLRIVFAVFQRLASLSFRRRETLRILLGCCWRLGTSSMSFMRY
jgi:hypothetical protein